MQSAPSVDPLGGDLRRVGSGFQIDGFRLHEKLYVGGMATLWRVTRKDETMPMVMKIPAFERGDPVSSLVGFEVEQMILPLLSGSHVPCFVQNGAIDAMPYMVMELIEGEDLLSLLDRTPLPLDEVVATGTAVAEALHDLHHQRAVHLDIKPENIVRRPDGRMVLVDFGLAYHEDVPDLLTDHFQVPLGTGAYIAPEQILGIRNDPRSDLFALGVLLYTLATGERPFGYPKTRLGVRQRLWRPPTPLRRLRPELPPWFQEIVLRLIEVDPDARRQTGGQLAFDFSLKEEIALTERAARMKRPGLLEEIRLWRRSLSWTPRRRPGIVEALDAAPIVLVAVDPSSESSDLNQHLERIVRRILLTEPLSRVVCINVMQTAVHQDDKGTYYKRFIELKAWAHRLKSVAERIICIVVTAETPAQAIIDYAKAHHVDHILIGASAANKPNHLGPVARRVVNGARCNVTIIRNNTKDEAASKFQTG
ncbi:Non-specific serine/threonine protein kinase [Azospirillaceae bacterium]